MKDYRTPLLLFLIAFVLITLLSCTSWLYPLQPVDDANWYMSIGKSMLRGKLLYTDVHDQKGPLLFFLHEWAAVLSPRSFIGIYLIEVLCAFGFLMFSYKTMRLFAGHGICLACTCMVGVLTYTSDFMWYGDTVEELSLPILLFVLYRTLRYAKSDELPGNMESVVIGMGLAAVFWMKFTVLALCTGALAALVCLAWQRGQLLLLLQVLTWSTVGACLLTAAVLSYFVWHGNEPDLYRSYFYFNVFLYTDAGRVSSVAWWPLKWTVWIVSVVFVLTRRVSRDEKLVVALCLGTALLPFVLFKIYLYYFLPVFVFAPLAIYYVRRLRQPGWVLALGASLLTVFAFATNFNLMTLLSGRFPKAVLSMAETVNADKDPDKEVLTVNSYDTGIYTLTDCLPPVKYFSTPNAYIEELVLEQSACLKSRRCKYLIRKDNGFVGYYGSFCPDLSKDYELIKETKDVYRPEFLLHPLEFMWTLGYMKRFIEKFHTPERREVKYQLYRLKDARSMDFETSGLIGEWRMCPHDGSRFVLSFSKHGLVRLKEYRSDKLKTDKTYSYTFAGGLLRLGYMSTGEEYKTIRTVGQSDTKLVLDDWPKSGLCILERL